MYIFKWYLLEYNSSLVKNTVYLNYFLLTISVIEENELLFWYFKLEILVKKNYRFYVYDNFFNVFVVIMIVRN
jgi:hypothetical protein